MTPPRYTIPPITVPPLSLPAAFNPDTTVTTISAFASRGNFILQHSPSGRPIEQIRQALLQNIPSGLSSLKGFLALSSEDQTLLGSLENPATFPPLEELSRTLRKITGSTFSKLAGRDPMGEVLKFVSSGSPPEDLLPGGRPMIAKSLMPGGLAGFSRNAGTVIGHAAKLVNNAFVRQTGIGSERPENEKKYGVERLTYSAFGPLPLPISLQEGETLYLETQVSEMAATQLYRESLLARMTETEEEAFLQAEREVTHIYEVERIGLSELLQKVKVGGGFPDSKKLNGTKWILEEMVRRSPYLQGRKVGPREFQILMKRHAAETWAGDEKGKRFLKRQAFGQERDYVLETLLIQVTEMMRSGKPPSEWRPYEELAAEAIGIYDRLIQGTDTRSSDENDLARIRSIAFPFEINWNEDRLRPVLAAFQDYEGERRDFMKVCRAFVAKIGPVATRVVEEAEKASMQREKVELEFQKIRLREQFERLSRYAEDQGKAISEEHRSHFERTLKVYTDSFEDYLKFWGPYARGEDVKAREHARNQKDKEVLFSLAFGTQWALEELYEIYDFRIGDRRQRPSCVSFSYVNSLRTMDEAIEKGQVTSDNIEAYFSAVWTLAPDAYQEIGLTFPGTKLTLGGRKIPSNASLDQLACVAGSFYSGNVLGATRYLGLEDKVHLVTQVPPHPDVALVAGADKVYPEGFLQQTNLSQQGIFLTANHSGILEFLMMIELGMLGIHAPQLAQGGVAGVPVFGDYVKSRAVVVERGEGSSEANQKIINFILRELAIQGYPAGTRLVRTAGGHPYAPSQVLGWKIVTDGLTSGQVPKVALELQEMSAGTDQDFLVAVLAQNGSKILPEPTWFLGKEAIEMILGNLSPKTTLNFQRQNQPRQIAFGPLLSSAGFLTEDDWREEDPSLFIHPDGEPYSPREAYVRALQLNANVITVLQRLTAAGMDLATPPEPTEAQIQRRAELQTLSPQERRRLTEEPMDRHVRARVAMLDIASAPVASKSELRPSLPPLPEEDKKRLDSVLSSDEADRLLAGIVETKTEEARALIREAVQRGAAYARREGDRLALDGDKVLWDHFFEVDPSELPEMLRNETIDQLSVPQGTGSTIKETINLNPQWVAFILGYHRVTGRAPVLFSSTMGPRLQQMACHLDTNPLVRRFFEALLGHEHLTSEAAQQLLSPESIEKNPRIITRQKIADYVETMMARFRESGFDLDAFSPVERQDILSMLKTNGDVHLKYRGLFPYRALVDDRSGNISHAVSYSSEGDPILALQPETFTKNAARLYLASNIETDVRQRLNQGRSGQALEVIRFLEDNHQGTGIVRFERRRRPQKIRGLIDNPITVELAREQIREHYQGPRDAAQDAVSFVKADIAIAAATQRDHHLDARIALAGLLGSHRIFRNVVIPETRLRNALKLLGPTHQVRSEITSEQDFEILEWVVRRIPDPELRQQAQGCIETLKDRTHLDLWADITPRRQGVAGRGLSVLGKAGSAIAGEVPNVAAALGQSLQHILGDAMKGELTGWRNILKLLTSREQRLLYKLGRFLENGKPPMSQREMAEAYGVVAERLGVRIAKGALDRAITNKNLTEETRKRLGDEREKIEERIEKVGQIIKRTIVDVWTLIDASLKVYGDLKDLGQASQDLVSGAILEGIGEYVKAQTVSLWKEIQKRRDAHGLNNPALPDASMATQIADNMLAEGIRIAGGEDNVIGWLLFQARLVLHQVGLDEAVRRLMDLPTNFLLYRNNRDAQKIAGLLRNRDSESADTAENLLRATAELMHARKPETAPEDFRKFFMTSWRHAYADDRGHFEEMAQQVYQAVFRA